MAVVSSPSGTPSIVYGAGDVTIDVLTAGASLFASCTVNIVRYCPHTVVTVTSIASDGHGNGSVILPTNSQVGDVVEVHASTGMSGGFTVNPAAIYPPTGETILGAAEPNNVYEYHVVLRKVSSTDWMPLTLITAWAG